ncbi:MAG: universal stress protein [Bacteroidetes bacterium]|nr:universal stress protein [Bacteroidota bacterium]
MENLPKVKIKYNSIVMIPTDFSEACNNAIHHGAGLAKSLNYSICILHVINKQTKSMLKKENLTLEYINDRLNQYKEEHEKEFGIKVETIAREGSIFSVINEVATEIKANLMVLGTHGKQGMQHLFGSYALRVVLDSPCPVVVVQKRSFGNGYHDIVIPITNEHETRQNIDWILLMAQLFNSKVTFFQAFYNDPDQDKRIGFITNHITRILDEKQVQYKTLRAEKSGDFENQVLAYAVKSRTELVMFMTIPHVDVPGFSVSTWAETLMFNEAEIPVMCINPTELGNYYYEWLTLAIS